METKNRIRWVTVLALVLPALLASCSREQHPSVTLSTGDIGGNYDVAGRAIARAVNSPSNAQAFRLEEKSSAGSEANIDAILAGTVAFGLAQADQQHQALNGTDAWTDRGPQPELRAVFSLYPEAVTLIAGADSGISSVGDLKGKRVDIGLPGSGTRQNAVLALTAAGLDWQSDIQAQQAPQDVRLINFVHGEIDAYLFTVGHPSRDVEFATISTRGARLIPLSNIDSIVSSEPYYSKVVIPAGQYPRAANSEDTETIALQSVLLTSASVPDDKVYALTKAVFENLALLRDHHPVLEGLRKEDMVKGFTAPIHPGALRYYQEVGISVPAQ